MHVADVLQFLVAGAGSNWYGTLLCLASLASRRVHHRPCLGLCFDCVLGPLDLLPAFLDFSRTSCPESDPGHFAYSFTPWGVSS